MALASEAAGGGNLSDRGGGRSQPPLKLREADSQDGLENRFAVAFPEPQVAEPPRDAEMLSDVRRADGAAKLLVLGVALYGVLGPCHIAL